MNLTIIITLVVIAACITAADLTIAVMCHKHARERGRLLGGCAVSAAVTAVSYLVSILTYNKTVTAFASGIYYSSIDWVLVYLALFAVAFADRKPRPYDRIMRRGLALYAVAENVVFMLNPFSGFAVDFIPRRAVVAHFVWQMHPVYYVHLAFTYALVLYILWLLLKSCISSPRQYRGQYNIPAVIIIAVVAVNAVFMFLPGHSLVNILDISVCGYSIGLYALYWGCYRYAETNMIETLSLSVFDDIDQALVLFDYKGRLIMRNKKVGQLLQDFELPSGTAIEDFTARCCPELSDAESIGDSYILQCTVPEQDHTRTLRCDYSRMRDKKGKIIAILFAFTDAQLESDLLTGFHAWDSFRRRLQAEPDWMTGPCTAAVFDINNLSVINSSFGREEGDRRLKALADSMRAVMPRGTYFVRGIDANLLAMRHEDDETAMLAMAEQVVSGSGESVQYAVSTIPEGGAILDAVDRAVSSLQVKKMLDSDSSQSQMLATLVQALQESDSDTEAHVQRTRRMGAALGQRLGLSDIQQGQLSLLCLLHDIGKIGIPLEILNKPGKLSDEEWAVLRSHVEKGYQIAMSSPHLQGIAEMIRHHHERWDGKGYPDGLSRESIPLLSRIISVVDAYDAMVNDRSYRRGIAREKAVEELRRCAGSQFDPTLVAEFITVLEEDPDIDGTGGRADNAAFAESIMPESRYQPDGDALPVQAIHPIRFSRYIVDMENRIIQADDTFAEMTGYTTDDIVSRTITQLDLIPPEERMNYQMILGELAVKNQILYLEHPLLRKDGTIIFVLCCGKQFYDSAARAARIEIIISDSSQTNVIRQLAATADSRAMQRLHQWEEVYRRDSLTGLLNHEAYRNDVEARLLDGHTRVVLLMMDLDKFKQYNDTYGHSAGDDYLVAVAQALKKILRRDDLASRMGGDEFSAALLFTNEPDEEQMVRRAGEIYDEITRAVAAVEGSTGISMGAAMSNDTGDTFRVLYQKADLALYDSKRGGRGRLTIYGRETEKK